MTSKADYWMCPCCDKLYGRARPRTVWRGTEVCHTCAVALARRAVRALTDPPEPTIDDYAAAALQSSMGWWADEESLGHNGPNKGNVREMFNEASKRAGLRPTTPHEWAAGMWAYQFDGDDLGRVD